MKGQRAGERGLIGKIMVIWLVVLALFVVLAIDTISIVRGHIQLSNVAEDAARAGADSYHGTRNLTVACNAAATSVADAHNGHLTRRGCLVDTQTGIVTITVRTAAWTILVGRVSPLRHFSRVVEKSSAGPPLG